ncbi:hypothetical protein WA026_020402 [Henosepilachna vigintioctopunctata]|uniref:Uncharacterized protein n=1 Tax=Henosepilachna vigintioctopunctata TaxID=420089 RepID=A0AAW1UHZ2_9CUCU
MFAHKRSATSQFIIQGWARIPKPRMAPVGPGSGVQLARGRTSRTLIYDTPATARPKVRGVRREISPLASRSDARNTHPTNYRLDFNWRARNLVRRSFTAILGGVKTNKSVVPAGKECGRTPRIAVNELIDILRNSS